MRHTARQKKKKPLLLITKQKLHSKTSKSTYFYKQWLNSLKSRSDNLANDFRWSSRHCEQNSSGFRLRDGANPTRSSRAMKSYSKIAHCGSSYILPAFCALALLLVLGVMINPFAQEGSREAYAAINEDLGNGSTISLAISNNGTEISDGGTVSTEVEPGELAYISNSIKVTTNKIARYYVGIQAANDGSSDLVGANTGATISGTGSNVKPSNFSDNTWGYVLTDNTTTSDEELAYSTLPAYNAGASLQYQSNQYPTNGEHEMKLVFAAKIRADKPADHYQTKALVSVAAEAKTLFGGIDNMQEMTSSICATARKNDSTQLIDIRDNKVYRVTKFNDEKCWMSQNLSIVNKTISDQDSDIESGSFTIPPSNISGFSTSDQYQPRAYYHESYGGYYNWYTATAGGGNSSVTSSGTIAPNSICPKGWRLPTSGNSTSDFYRLIDGLTYQQLTRDPYNFVYGGRVGNSLLERTGIYSFYWSSVFGGDKYPYNLRISSAYGNDPSNKSAYIDCGRECGVPVRCVAR